MAAATGRRTELPCCARGCGGDPDLSIASIALGYNDVRRNSDGGGSRGDVLQNDGVGAYLCIVPDGDRTEQYGSGTNEDEVPKNGMNAEAGGLLLPNMQNTECHPVQQGAIVADLGGGADDDAVCVYEFQPTPDGGLWVDIYPATNSGRQRDGHGQ